MSLFGGVGSKIAELAQQVISNNAKFESLERLTTRTLEDFQTLILRFEDRLRELESLHVREVAGHHAEIQVLEGRLNALSEQALHAVAEKTIRDMGRGEKSSSDLCTTPISPEMIRLPLGPGAADADRSP